MGRAASELQEKNTELQKVATNYYLYITEGEGLFCERHNCWIYPDNRSVYWHLKVAGYLIYILPNEISISVCMCIGVRI